MATNPPISIEHLRELGRRHGVALDDARAADLLPRASSLAERLSAMAARLPQDAPPAPGPPPPARPKPAA
jgi:hypothetical protein